MTPEGLDALWTEAGRPVCCGITDRVSGSRVMGYVDQGYVDMEVEPDIGPPRAFVRDIRPDWDDPATEHLLMCLAEEAVGHPLEWTTIHVLGEDLWLCPNLPWSEQGYTRTELALRIIAAAQVKKDGAA